MANRFSHEEQVNEMAERLYRSVLGGSIPVGERGLSIDNFAFHIGLIMSEPAPAEFGLHFGGGRVEVEIRRAPLSESEGPVWDQVTLNGVHVGNRCGARQVYSAIVKPFLSPTWGESAGETGELAYSTVVTYREAAEAVLRAREDTNANG